MIDRLCLPTKFDIQPYGTIYKVLSCNNNIEYFIQVGTEKEIIWRPIKDLIDTLLSPLYENEEFVNELLILIQDSEKNLLHFADLIKTKA